MDENEMKTVCGRCGNTRCVGLAHCQYDGYPNPGTAQVPAIKLARHEAMVATEKRRKAAAPPKPEK